MLAPPRSRTSLNARRLVQIADEYREPLVLQVLMGFSTAEIARELDLSGAAVLTRLFRARKQLVRMCGEDTSMDPENDGTARNSDGRCWPIRTIRIAAA